MNRGKLLKPFRSGHVEAIVYLKGRILTICSGLTGESTETLTNVEDTVLEGWRTGAKPGGGARAKQEEEADQTKPGSELLFPELMKVVRFTLSKGSLGSA